MWIQCHLEFYVHAFSITHFYEDLAACADLVVDHQVIQAVIILFSFVQHSSTASTVPTNGTGPSESADDDLPSVMTCANYLKLPPYSSKVPYIIVEVHYSVCSLSLVICIYC